MSVLAGRDRTNEKGLTLIELLVTVVILGLAFVVILGGMTTAILGSDVHHRQVTADAILRSTADEFRSDEVPYVPCAASYPLLNADPPDSPYLRTAATVIGYWNPSTNKFEGVCSTDHGLQLLKLSVTANARSVTETMQVVKRQP